MDWILETGIAIILWLQSLGDWLFAPMQFFSFLGTEEFYLLVAPALLWCLDAGLGLRVGLFLMVSNSLNAALKLLFHGPRPYWYDRGVAGLGYESSFGVPSGHAQNAVVVFGALARFFKQGWGWAAATVLIFLIGLSRSVLGVHFPHDVLIGWLIGLLLFWALLRLETPLLAWFRKQSQGRQALAAFLASLILILPGAWLRLALNDWTLPPAWAQNSLAAFPEEAVINPLDLAGVISNAGAFFGLAVGAIWLKPRGGFDPGGPAWKRLLRYLLGLIGVFLLWRGLGLILPRGEAPLPFLLRYLRYALIGVWITALAPLLFRSLKLAEAAPNSHPTQPDSLPAQADRAP